SATMVLRRLTEEPIEIEKIDTTAVSKMVTFSFAERPQAQWTRPDRAEYLIEAKLADHVLPGKQLEIFTLYVKCKRFPWMKCGAQANVKAFYTVTPTRLNLPPPGKGPPAEIAIAA
ncbi:unnamed protein product, partial [marine sediment metagenome]